MSTAASQHQQMFNDTCDCCWKCSELLDRCLITCKGQTQQMGVDSLLPSKTLLTAKAVEQTGLKTVHAVASKQVTATPLLSSGRLLSLNSKPHIWTKTHQDSQTETHPDTQTQTHLQTQLKPQTDKLRHTYTDRHNSFTTLLEQQTDLRYHTFGHHEHAAWLQSPRLTRESEQSEVFT